MTVILSILLINVTQSLVATQQVRDVSAELRGRLLIIDSFGSSDFDESTIIELAETHQVNLANFLMSEDPLELTIAVHLSSNTLLERLSLNENLDFNTFNTLPYALSSKNKHEAYYINFKNAQLDLTLIPLHENLDQSLFVSAESNEQIDAFILALSDKNISVFEAPIDEIQVTDSLITRTLRFFLVDQVVLGFLIVYIAFIIHRQYQSYRTDTILRLQGYLDRNIWFDKIKIMLMEFISVSIVVALSYAFVFINQPQHRIMFLKLYPMPVFIVSIFLLIVISLMQLLSFKSNHLNALQGRRHRSYFYALIIIKVLMVPVLSRHIISDISQIQDLLLEREYLREHAYLNESILTLDVLPGQYDLEYWSEQNDQLYESLSENLTILYSRNLTGDSYDETVIYMNNNYFNTLNIVDSKGKSVKAHSDHEVLVLSNASNVELTLQQLERPILCSFTGVEDCSTIDVIGLSDDFKVPIIGNNAELIPAPFIIITGQKPDLFVDYNFDAHTHNNLESSLEAKLKGFPIRIVNLETRHLQIEQAIRDSVIQIGLQLLRLSIVLILMIITLYRVHYDIYKQSYSNLFMNGNSPIGILAPMFGFQLLINGLSSILSWIYQKRIFEVFLIFIFILIVELLTYLGFTQILKRNIIKNVKGG